MKLFDRIRKAFRRDVQPTPVVDRRTRRGPRKPEDPSWAWLDKIQAGDILFDGGRPDKPRVVREAKYWGQKDKYGRAGKLHCVTFTIQHCSWTGACYTVLGRTDLKSRRFSPSGKRKTTMQLIDKLIAHDIQSMAVGKRKLDCCDVKGIR